MTDIRCEACGEKHYLTVAMLARLVKEFQAGNMQLVSRDFPARWEQVGGQKTIRIKPRCLYECEGVVRQEPKKRGRPRKQ